MAIFWGYIPLTVDTIDPIDPQKTCPLTPKGFTQPIQGAQLSRPTEAPLRELHSRGNNCRACDIGWWFLAVQPIPQWINLVKWNPKIGHGKHFECMNLSCSWLVDWGSILRLGPEIVDFPQVVSISMGEWWYTMTNQEILGFSPDFWRNSNQATHFWTRTSGGLWLPWTKLAGKHRPRPAPGFLQRASSATVQCLIVWNFWCPNPA